MQASHQVSTIYSSNAIIIIFKASMDPQKSLQCQAMLSQTATYTVIQTIISIVDHSYKTSKQWIVEILHKVQ